MKNKIEFHSKYASISTNPETIQLPNNGKPSIKCEIIRNRFAYTRLDGNIESYNIYTN